MAGYFKCNVDLIKFPQIFYYKIKALIKAEITYKYKELSLGNRLINSTYHFDFETGYLEDDGIWYKGRCYNENQLDDFFKQIKNEFESIDRETSGI